MGGRWAAKLVALLLAMAALWVRILTSLRKKMGDISKGMANILARKKKLYSSTGYVSSTFWLGAVYDQ
jgi:hypothetical protein